MKLQSFTMGFILGVAAAIAGGAAIMQDRGGAAPQQPAHPAPDEMQKMMQAWMDASTPGEQHAQLLKTVGDYDMVTRIWMAGPDAPPTECKGTSKIESICNGHFIQQTDHNSYPIPDMKTGEMKMTPMEGVGIVGYDKYQRMYVGCWADSLNTYMLQMRGVMSPDGKTLTMYGEMDEPMLGVRGRMVKYVTNHVSDDKYTFTIFDLAAGENYKVVEVEYSRRK